MNIYKEVQSLQRSPIEVGGICAVWYFRKEDVLTWPIVDPVTGTVLQSVVMKPGKGMFICEAAEKGRSYEEEVQYTSAGPLKSIDVTAKLGGNNTANILSLDAMTYSEWGLIVKDRAGYYRLIGDADTCARFTYKHTPGDDTTSRIVQLKWEWSHPIAAPIYQSQLFSISIGTVTISTGTLSLIMRFRVGDVGAPMNAASTTLTQTGFANKNLLVLADGVGLPVDDGSGTINWAPLATRHIEKTFAGDTITFVGGVTNQEIIEIYAFE